MRPGHIFVTTTAAAILTAALAFAGEGTPVTAISISTIEHAKQRYSTAGDWQLGDGTIHVTVSALGQEDYEFLVGLHEMIEAYLCQKRGISEQLVTAFDNLFEAERAAGKHGPEDEPGDSRRAPYGKEHRFATRIERLVASELGVDWSKYEAAIAALGQEEGK